MDKNKYIKGIWNKVNSYYNIKLMAITFTQKFNENFLSGLEYMDDNILKEIMYNKSGDFIIDWFTKEFVKAMISNSNILIEMKQKRITDSNNTRKSKNDKIIYIMKQFVDGGNLDNDTELINQIDSILNKSVIDNYEIYKVLGIELFKDSLIAEDTVQRDFYHGTLLAQAREIINSGGFSNLSSLGSTKKSYYNSNKIFFTDDFDTSLQYTNKFGNEGLFDEIVFKVDISKYNIYKREHLLVERQSDTVYFIKDIDVKADCIKEIYHITDKDIKLITKEELLEMRVSSGRDRVNNWITTLSLQN